MVVVHILIDLHWQNQVSGHIKSWMQFAKVAQKIPSEVLDLTVHFHGDHHQKLYISPNVCYVLHCPRLSTKKLPFLQDVPSHTDLCSYTPTLIPYLARSDLVHTTHPLLTFGRTAEKVCPHLGKPLVSSIHTDTPLYAQIYLEEKIQKILGINFLSRFLLQTLCLPEKYKNSLTHKQYRHWQACQHVWYAQGREQKELMQFVPGVSISRLRRGIDKKIFNPQQCDRDQLQKLYGIPIESFLLLFVGRLDACKNLMTFAKTIKVLLKRQLPVHGIAVGKGTQEANIKTLLGENISLLGALEQEKLALIYASADLFVFPSETETLGNVVLEAKASGLVPYVSNRGGVTQLIKISGQDGLIIAGQNPTDWADRIQFLYEHPQKLEIMRKSAYNHIQRSWPTWERVLKEDLLPVWTAIANISDQ